MDEAVRVPPGEASVTPYRSAAEWMFHQDFDSASVVDVAANWHEHHKAALGADDVAGSTVRESALAFINLADAAGLGKLVLGRRNNPTRLVVDKGALRGALANPGRRLLLLLRASDYELLDTKDHGSYVSAKTFRALARTSTDHLMHARLRSSR